ncbi:MAG TPA: iron-containing redox enzyme family protein [Actinocrinis sp.]|nr:iron-containing redox enzyme family protein [Actinocrinis sp.]
MANAYITGVGAYLPGDPIDNEELAARYGGDRRRDALRGRVLAANGIRQRHYAVDVKGNTLMLNEELAERAVRAALGDRGLPAEALGMLATGTTQGDLLVPGFASMVHGRLGGGPMELLSASGVCGSGMAALGAAVRAVRAGEHEAAAVVGSELVSRSLLNGPAGTADTQFLRWTLSDGAGAVIVESAPRSDGLSLRVDWVHLTSRAHEHPVCMSSGMGSSHTATPGETWMDRGAADFQDAPRLRQDMAALPALVDFGVAEYAALIASGRIDPATEHVLCHYSAEHFRRTLFARLADAGFAPSEQAWFSSLTNSGNTGAASIFVTLSQARARIRPGERVLLVVPESGRFQLAFAQLTCVSTDPQEPAGPARSPLGRPEPGDGPGVVRAFEQLGAVWDEFDHCLARVPVVRRIQDGTATLADYRRLLLNLRQQVVDGGRWISLAAANFSTDVFWLRSAAIQHAADEHKDYQLLERDFANVGGDPALMAATAPNIGSAALSAFVFHRAGLPDPVDLLGAMFVIEGLGAAKADGWARRLRETLGLTADQVSFLSYHGVGDDDHYATLRLALRSGLFDDAAVARIVRTARVVARLYILQLEELDNV